MEETAKITNAQMTARSMENTLKTVTECFLKTLDRKNLPTPDEAAEGIMEAVTGAFSLHNAAASKEEKWAIPKVLFPAQIADIIKALYHVVNVSLTGGFTDEDYDIPAIYQESGDWEGTYSISEWSFKKIIRQVSYTISERGIAEVMAALRITAPHVKVCEDVDLVPVGNGIFNYKTKRLMPFTPEKVFLRKCSVNYRQSPMNPMIYNKDDGSYWDVESWMGDISDDPAVVELLWQITGAVIRPGVKWNRIAMFYSQEGNNGKGTLCQLLENLCGKKNCTNIPMQDFSKDFLLESLIGKYAIIVNENDVDTYLNKAGILKAVITGDTIQINRKFKQPVSYQFRGFMVQCVNGLPKTKDKSNSLYRRMLIVPFKKCFTGAERKYIKTDYINRQEVLEYVLWRVLNMDYYELDEPAECRNAMAEFREDNEPVLAFWNEFRDQFAWDELPFKFLYDLYKAWHLRFNQGGALFGDRTFIRELRRVIENDHEWEATDNAPMNRKKMYKPEYLVDDYKLFGWKWYDNGVHKYGPPVTMRTYKGLYRVTPAGGTGAGGQP